MSTQLAASLSFHGDARQAMEFYHDVFGGTLISNTFAEFGMAGTPHADQIMHAQLELPHGITLMAGDTPPGMDYVEDQRVTLMFYGDDETELRGYWDRLVEGGTVGTPLETQMWGDTYGVVADRFGIIWSINIEMQG